jgi:hypothetical protein
MAEAIEELETAVERLEQSDEALRDWLRDRDEAERLTSVTRPRSAGGSGVGPMTVKASKPGAPCYYTVHPSGTLYVSKTHPNTRGGQVPAEKAEGTLLRRAVEYYPRFVVKIVEEVNGAATTREASLPDSPVGDMELSA